MSQNFNIGAMIELIALVPSLVTADRMLILLSPSLLERESIGARIDRQSGNYWVVKFAVGTFLMEDRDLAAIDRQLQLV
jgi:Protein of unknown function (DUF3148)